MQKIWHGPADYRIKTVCSSTRDLRTWFDGFSIESDGAATVLTGSVADQAALHGILAIFRNLNMPIISVRRCGTDQDSTAK